ncbi:hypothetical protein MPH_12359 [Macrophomina phaseolina MS6]|uniref:Uncharacterized protein n=1 Tax=Macrophomina phaseolina (strain MS6) TaxID=1126212 RepID=K2QL09_MACPH|nr:hypothetical protein MPH_12359 [Macrophomina phaseolina MS6]
MHPLYRHLNPRAAFQPSLFHPAHHQPGPYIAPCIAEFDSPLADPKDASTRTYIGWLPRDGAAHEAESYEAFEDYDAQPAMDAEPLRACLQVRFGLDQDYEDAASAAADGCDMPDPDAFGPLAWLRMPVHTRAPATARPEGEKSAFVYLMFPALVWYGDDGGHEGEHVQGGITLSRYDLDYAIPPYVRAAMRHAGLTSGDMCCVDVRCARYPLSLMPGKWMRLASPVDNALLYDLRGLSRVTEFRLHMPWTDMLEWRVGDTAERVKIEVEGRGGVADCAKVRGRGLFPGQKGDVGLEAWGNFLEWREKRSAGHETGMKVVGVCDHKISSTVERLGLVITEEEAREMHMQEMEKQRRKKKPKAQDRRARMPHRRTMSDYLGSAGVKGRGRSLDWNEAKNGEEADDIDDGMRVKRKSSG